MKCRLLLNGVLALHIELACHLIAVVCEEIVVERFHVAGNTTSDTCGMCSEDSSHLRQLVVDVEQTQSGHPLIGMINDLVRLL